MALPDYHCFNTDCPKYFRGAAHFATEPCSICGGLRKKSSEIIRTEREQKKARQRSENTARFCTNSYCPMFGKAQNGNQHLEYWLCDDCRNKLGTLQQCERIRESGRQKRQRFCINPSCSISTKPQDTHGATACIECGGHVYSKDEALRHAVKKSSHSQGCPYCEGNLVRQWDGTKFAVACDSSRSHYG